MNWLSLSRSSPLNVAFLKINGIVNTDDEKSALLEKLEFSKDAQLFADDAINFAELKIADSLNLAFLKFTLSVNLDSVKFIFSSKKPLEKSTG